MARSPRDSRIETREARRRLKLRREPYWRHVHSGLALGYYRGVHGGRWIVRHLEGRVKTQRRLGLADDFADADGKSVFSYGQAMKLAMEAGAARSEPAAEASRTDPSLTVKQAIEAYMADYQARGGAVADAWLKARAHILPALGHRAVARLSTEDIEAWRNNLVTEARGQATANRVLTLLKAALNFSYRRGRVASDAAWRSVSRFRRADNPRQRFLTRQEAKRLCNAADPHFTPLIRAALLTGCRYGELCQVQVRDFHPEAGTLALQQTKSGQVRHVPLTAEGQRYFEELTAGRAGEERIFLRADGEPWGAAQQVRRMHEACKRAKITPAVSFHILRHTYGSLLALDGVPLQVIAAVLGHTSTRMTEKHYAHLQPDFVAKAVRASLPSFGIPVSNVRSLTSGKKRQSRKK